MIFVTVGTHEQQFNRLIKKIDELKECQIIKDDVFIQTGFSDYIPTHCQYSKMLGYDEMTKMYETADIIITHGGPASFMKVLEYNKIPVVVPRVEKYGEHVNDHQLEFARYVNQNLHNMLLVEDIDELELIIVNFHERVNEYRGQTSIRNNEIFNQKLKISLEKLVGGEIGRASCRERVYVRV